MRSLLPKKFHYGELSQNKRSLGGLEKKRFKDTLKVSLKYFGITPNCLEYLAQDRGKCGVKFSNVDQNSMKPEETQQLSYVGNLEKPL